MAWAWRVREARREASFTLGSAGDDDNREDGEEEKGGCEAVIGDVVVEEEEGGGCVCGCVCDDDGKDCGMTVSWMRW